MTNKAQHTPGRCKCGDTDCYKSGRAGHYVPVQPTPGPWSITEHNRSDGKGLARSIWPDDRSGRVCGKIADVSRNAIVSDNESAANARLIAAAPDMAAVLKSLIEFWDNVTPVHPGAEIVDDARAAIAKSTGEVR
jgi:hypothetical protein